MNVIIKNKKLINIIYAACSLLDIGIAFFVNIISDDDFNLFAKHNIIIIIVFLLLILTYVIFQLILRSGGPKYQNRRLQKAFQDGGGYETVVSEMKKSVEQRDYKNIKKLKKIVDYIER